MGEYKNILIAAELNPEIDDAVIVAAIEIAKKNNANIIMVHAIEHIGAYGGTYGVTIAADMEELLLKHAQTEMKKLADKVGLSEDKVFIKFGSAKALILDTAEEEGVDLIVVGSHGRHGIQVVLGSTANAILHRAKCDVLAVRLKN